MSANSIKTLMTVSATNTGGRNGHSETDDHSVSVNLGTPKELGGPGAAGTTTPEHLFAAGYAACFGGAFDLVGKMHKKDASGTVTKCDVGFGPREGGGYGISVKMHLTAPHLTQAEAEVIAKETHEKICPYSHATRGNIDFDLVVVGN